MSIRVRGVTYTSPDEAYVAASELENHADTVAANLRRSGKEGEADQVQDRGHADAEKLRSWARTQSAHEAAGAPQPAGRPTTPPASSRTTRTSSPRRSRSAPAAAASTIYVESGGRAAARSWGSLGWQIAGLSIGAALLTLFLQPRGVGAFSALAGGGAKALSYIVDPIDPLAPRKQSQARALASPTSYAHALAAATAPRPAAVSPLRAYTPKLTLT